jgi:predicted CxxxxCH...CXXCH cytochrome family protein
MLRHAGLALALAPLALLAACDKARPLAGGSAAACVRCHGDPATGSPAPATGAHQVHLAGTALDGAVTCGACHVVPAVGVWGPPARSAGAQPRWDRTSGTCSNVYCHGATTPGGPTATPAWTSTAALACTSCHGLPPATPEHAAVAADAKACAGCHAATVRADGTIDVAGGKHVNGVVDLPGGGGCTACHGDPNRAPAALAPAPPRDTKGNTATTAAGVGAHQAHLAGGALRAALACTDCHVVPTSTAHAQQPLNLTWSALATDGGRVTPTFDATALTCANYCHGATLSGGSNPSPRWTGGAAEAACGSCHGLPPGGNHPAVSGGVTTCNGCHPLTVKPDGTIDVAGGKHVDGSGQTNLTCTSCHGGTLSGGTGASGSNPIAAAPPRGTKGETATSTRAVGLHAQHLTRTALSTSVVCSSCHTVPTSTSHANGSVTVAFAAPGSGGTWNGTTCSSTYCHGAASVAWANATVPTLTCTSCHGNPPGSGQHDLHVNGKGYACSVCHGTGYGSSGVNAALHVNGVANVGAPGSHTLNWTGSGCNPSGCHGSESW